MNQLSSLKEMNLVTRASLSQELLNKLSVPFPSLEEQKQIANFLTIKDNVLIGMGAIVMDNCVIESNSIVAAGSVITQNTVVESGCIYAGVPAKKVKDIDQSDFAGEIERISNNYVMYSSWFKEE